VFIEFLQVFNSESTFILRQSQKFKHIYVGAGPKNVNKYQGCVTKIKTNHRQAVENKSIWTYFNNLKTLKISAKVN